jgi:hypothetical protein
VKYQLSEKKLNQREVAEQPKHTVESKIAERDVEESGSSKKPKTLSTSISWHVVSAFVMLVE